MNFTSIEEIKQLNIKFLEIDEHDYEKFIAFYKNNNSFIDIDKSDQHLDLKLKALGNYGRVLYLTKSFKRAIPILKETLKIMESKKLTDSYYFEFIQSIYAESLYFSKDFKEAKDIYQKLKIEHPKNEIYKSWFNFSRYRSLKWIASTLLIVGATLIIGYNYLFPDNSLLITIIGITVAAATFLGEWVLKQYLDRNHKNALNK